MHRIIRVTFSIGLGLAVGGAATIASAAQSPVLAPGQPPLTQEMVDKFNGFFEWALDAPMTDTQRHKLQDSLIGAWTSGDQETVDTVRQIVTTNDQLGAQPEAARAVAQAKLQNGLLADLRQQPDDPLSQFLLGVYGQAHHPLADGNPPLTRQMSDAHLEFIYFAADQIAGTSDQPPARLKDAWAKTLAQAYPTYAPEQQQQLARMPLYWAAVRATWPGLSEAEKASYRQQWVPIARALVTDDSGQSASDDSNTAQGDSDQPAAAGSSGSPPSTSQSSSSDIASKLKEHNWVSNMVNNSASITWVNHFNAQANFGSSPYRLTYSYGWKH